MKMILNLLLLAVLLVSARSYSQTGSTQPNNILILTEDQVNGGLVRKALSEALARENEAIKADRKKDSLLIQKQNNTIQSQGKSLSLSLDYGKKSDSALKTCEDLNAEYAEERKRLNNRVGLLGGALAVVTVAATVILIAN